MVAAVLLLVLNSLRTSCVLFLRPLLGDAANENVLDEMLCYVLSARKLLFSLLLGGGFCVVCVCTIGWRRVDGF
jgi:hypothetical protein